MKNLNNDNSDVMTTNDRYSKCALSQKPAIFIALPKIMQ